MGGLFVLLNMGAQKQIGFIAGPGGEVVKWEPPQQPPQPLTAPENRYSACVSALRRLDEFFVRHGFRCNAIENSSNAISFEHSGFMFDVSIRDPRLIAYVTSHVGYRYEKKFAARSATVKILGETIRSDMVVQVVCSRQFSGPPVYVEVPDNTSNVQNYVIAQVMGVIQMMADTNPTLQQVLHQQLGPTTSGSPECSGIQADPCRL